VSRAAGPSASRLRAAIAALSLIVLALSLARSFEPSATLARARRLVRGLRGDFRPQSEAAGFWFDPDFAAFLDDVKKRTPPDATVAVLVPLRPDLYRFQASYQLAPRRVVEERWKGEAGFIATYRTDAARGPGGVPIVHGELWAR
jgi:hypothetical protein